MDAGEEDMLKVVMGGLENLIVVEETRCVLYTGEEDGLRRPWTAHPYAPRRMSSFSSQLLLFHVAGG